jgi:uncharacterized alkaline shock family protein YloU
MSDIMPQTNDTFAPPAGGQSPAGGDHRPSLSVERAQPGGGAMLRSDRGTTTIASSVVAKIAGLATQEIPGVQAMGKTLSRTLGTLRSKVGTTAGSASAQGVSVEVGERQAAVDIDIVAYYGQSIVETADAIRENVIDRIERWTGLEVVEVNVNVDDLYFDDDSSKQESRVA